MNTNETHAMFCRQCQETAGNFGCTKIGVCGKNPVTAGLMDELIARLEDLATVKAPSRDLARFVTAALFMTLTNANFDDDRLRRVIVDAEQMLGRSSLNKKPKAFGDADPNERSLKELVLFGLKGVAAYRHHAAVLGKENEELDAFVLRALKQISRRTTVAELSRLALECGRQAVAAMALLDNANTSAYGNPMVTRVDLGVGTRPGILVSGHDLRDLEELLEQSQDAGIDIYTHGEMLPAHYYPELRKYPHLKGNYGGAWYRQQGDFATFNGVILMTTNCLVPVSAAYRDRIFTTGVAGYPGVPHIPDRIKGRPKDFSAVIARAKRCAPPKELETGDIVGGFAHSQVLALKDRIVAAVKAGRIRQFIVMAGCDGRHTTRDYYTRVALALPNDAVILTAGCAKYRYIKVVKDEIDGIPRVLDAGQCNDAYSLVRIALALRDALDVTSVNELPLEFDIAWYEQKAVAVLLALLSLGFRNIRIGPTLPAFLSSDIVQVLTERFGLRGIGSVDEDVCAMTS